MSYAKAHIYAKTHMQAMHQPFIVGRPVTGKYFIDREAELKKLEAILSGTPKGDINNAILLGLRRTGKSSILLNLQEKLSKDKRVIPIIFDAYGISTKERFGSAYMSAILNAYSKHAGNTFPHEKIKRILSTNFDKIRGTVAEFEAEISEFIAFRLKFKESRVNEDELLEHALQYPEKLGDAKNVSFVVMIDEFQDLLKWGDEFLRMFRRLMQSQSRVAYVISGSAPTIMKQMIYDAKSPFYKQLIEVHVRPLTKNHVRSFVKRRLRTARIVIEEQSLERIFQLSSGLPDYVQRLGLQIYLNCLSSSRANSGKRAILPSDVEDAYREMTIQLDPDFGNIFKAFSDLEKEILIALAHGIENPGSIAAEIRRPQSSLPKTLGRLMSQDIIERHRSGRYRIIDAIFSDWLSKRFSNYPP